GTAVAAVAAVGIGAGGIGIVSGVAVGGIDAAVAEVDVGDARHLGPGIAVGVAPLEGGVPVDLAAGLDRVAHVTTGDLDAAADVLVTLADLLEPVDEGDGDAAEGKLEAHDPEIAVFDLAVVAVELAAAFALVVAALGVEGARVEPFHA